MRILPLLLVLFVVFAPAPDPAAAQTRGWEYRVRFDEGLQTMQVEICFRNFSPRRLTLGERIPLQRLRFDTRGPNATRVEVRPDGVYPIGLRSGGCIRYSMAIDSLRGGGRRQKVNRVGKDIIGPPGALFLKPALWPGDAQVGLSFELPQGYRAAVPWPADPDTPGRYLPDRFALRLEGLIAVGRFPVDEIRVAGTVVDIAVLDAPRRASPEGIRTWIRAAVSAVADLYGKFPMPHVTALIQPVPSGKPGVVFGQAMRAGGGHVHLLLSSRAQDSQLPGEWIAIHEMTHLGMPWTYDTDSWLQEGFVTYYQEVLRARAGFLTEQGGWQQLHEGFGRGRRSGGSRTLADESKDMYRYHTFHRVYWGGAAIALRIDVELRKRSGGRRSLDDVMRMLQRNFGTTRQPHHAIDLMRAVDRWLGQPICTVIADVCLQSRKFPSVEPAYEALGLISLDGRVVYAKTAPQAADRSRIMQATKWN